jgi:hypothetical protein
MSAVLYSPPQFLTLEVLADVLGEFSWPAPFTLVDDRPDGIEIHLPRCRLYVSEDLRAT